MSNLNVKYLILMVAIAVGIFSSKSRANESAPVGPNKYVSVLLGGFYRLDSPANNDPLFDYGIKLAMDVHQVSFGQLTAGLSYDRASASDGINTASQNDIHAELLVKKFKDTGFYFGPNAGVAIATRTGDTGNVTKFEAGVGAGYEFTLSNQLMIGPDLRYEHLFGASAYNVLKFAGALTLVL